MQYRPLGNTGITVSTLAFGGAPVMSRANRRESWQALEAASKGGVTLYDTAPLYGQGDSERLIGEFFAGRRDDVVICTKCGQSVSERSLARTALAFKDLARPIVKRFKAIKKAAASFLQSRTATNDFTPDAIVSSVDASLRRLATDYIDILLMHEPDMASIQRGDAFEQFERLREAGKIRTFGVSCNTAEEGIAAIERAPGLGVVQVPLSIWDREPIDQLLPLARDRGVGIIARGALSKGAALQAQPDEPATVTELRRRVAEAGRRHGLSLAQALLLHNMQQPAVSTVLASMITPDHAAENIAAMDAAATFGSLDTTAT